MAVVANHAVPPEYDLLRGGSDLLDVALLAARGSAAARRVVEGGTLDKEDLTSLRALANLFRASASAVRSFGPHPPASAPPGGALAARVDVAIDAVLHDVEATADVASLAKILEDRASAVEALVEDGDASHAAALVEALSALASAVLRETGHVGEVTTTL